MVHEPERPESTGGAERWVADRPKAATGDAPALRLDGLVKSFGPSLVVDHVDLTVPRGSLFGLVGPNGAGKTTSISMAVGLLRPDAGRSRVFGVDVWANPLFAKRLLGVLPDGLALPERLTGRELLTFMGRLREMDAGDIAQRTDELLTVLDLTSAERTLVIDYSTGMRKKIGLALALLHAPRLLVLDEPFEAVDPISAATLKVILARFVASGGSVLLSSHVMALVEQLCDAVAIIASGKVVAAGPLDEVRNGEGLEEVFVRRVGVQVAGEEGLSWLAS